MRSSPRAGAPHDGGRRAPPETGVGPLARLEELRGRCASRSCRLAPAPRGFSPSHGRGAGRGGPSSAVTLTPGASASLGTLRLPQGAFGFAPRLVVLRDGRTDLDRTCRSDRASGRRGTAFTATWTSHPRRPSPAKWTSSARRAMRGHPTLGCAVRKGGTGDRPRRAAAGRVRRPGGGYRMGFAGCGVGEIDVVAASDRLGPCRPTSGGGARGAGLGGAALAARRRA